MDVTLERSHVGILAGVVLCLAGATSLLRVTSAPMEKRAAIKTEREQSELIQEYFNAVKMERAGDEDGALRLLQNLAEFPIVLQAPADVSDQFSTVLPRGIMLRTAKMISEAAQRAAKRGDTERARMWLRLGYEIVGRLKCETNERAVREIASELAQIAMLTELRIATA